MINSVPNFILAFIPAEISADTLNTMTAFAVRVIHLSPGIIVDLRCRLVAYFQMFFYISFHTRLWVNTKTRVFILS